MKKALIYILILINLFTNICSMEKSKIQKSLFLKSPNEIKLYIFELLIKNIIENNSIFEPYNNVKETIDNISLVNSEFNNFKSDLIKFSKKYIKKYFADTYINLTQEEQDAQLIDIFTNIRANNSKEKEIEAAKLIIAGANVNLIIIYNTLLTNASLLMLIIRTNKFKNLVNLLIRYRANIEMEDDNGNTALMWAAMRGRKNIAKLLIEEGANINAKNKSDKTALIWAAGNEAERLDMVKLFINSGAVVNAKDNSGNTALMKAVQHGHKGIAKLLIASGIDLELKDNAGYTALMWAARYDYAFGIVELLITAGANINAKSDSGNTALAIAITRRHKNIVEILKSTGTK